MTSDPFEPFLLKGFDGAKPFTHVLATGPRDDGLCRVFWGSHGCQYERGHDGEHCCSCGFGAPYYGPETRFYGEDSIGLPQVSDLDRPARDVS